MSHHEKVSHLLEELGARGISVWEVAPPVFRFFWLVGLEIPPPYFMGFLSLAIVMGGLLALILGAFVWLVLCLPLELPASIGFSIGLFAGTISGPFAAAHYRRRAESLQLPPWDKYPLGSPQNTDVRTA
jgi:hypothetical protein